MQRLGFRRWAVFFLGPMEDGESARQPQGLLVPSRRPQLHAAHLAPRFAAPSRPSALGALIVPSSQALDASH